jgi:multidrug efflux pump subunit AcrA (membrane-fusion protein)
MLTIFKTFQPTQVTNASDLGTAVAIRGNLSISASGSGTLVAETDASFGFDTSGQVTQVNVKVGDQVEAGQVLARLDDTLVQMKYDETQQAMQELYSTASIAAVKQEISTAQDAQVAARDWLSYLLSPEVIDAEENLAAAEQRLWNFSHFGRFFSSRGKATPPHRRVAQRMALQATSDLIVRPPNCSKRL